MNIETAAAELSRNIFGDMPSLHRLGRVRTADGTLHVHTCVPPAAWPEGRARSYGGYPVVWHFVGKADGQGDAS